MRQIKTKQGSRSSIAVIGVTTALYVAFAFMIAPLSYGAIQVRLSEMFNHLVDFNKRYIYAMILGCLIVNMGSPLGPIDMLVGTAGTAISCFLIYIINKHVKNLKVKLVVSTLIPTFIGMLPIAFELHIMQHLPFWVTYASTAAGEFVSCLIGAFIIYFVSKKINLTK